MAKKTILPIEMILTGLLIFSMQVFSQEKDKEAKFAERAELKEGTIVITIKDKIVNRIPLVKIDEIVPLDKVAKEKIANMREDVRLDVEKIKIHKKAETTVYFSRDSKYFAIQKDSDEGWHTDDAEYEKKHWGGLVEPYHRARNIKYMSADGTTLWEKSNNANFAVHQISLTGKYIVCGGGSIIEGEKETVYLLNRNGKEIFRFGAPMYSANTGSGGSCISDDEKYLIVHAYRYAPDYNEGKPFYFWGLIDIEKKAVRKSKEMLCFSGQLLKDGTFKTTGLAIGNGTKKMIYIELSDLEKQEGKKKLDQLEFSPEESVINSSDVEVKPCRKQH